MVKPGEGAGLSPASPRPQGRGSGAPPGPRCRPPRTPAGAPLTVDAQHPLLLVFWARLKLLDEVPATLQCHTRHLGHEPGACHCATVPAAPTACSDTLQLRPLRPLAQTSPTRDRPHPPSTRTCPSWATPARCIGMPTIRHRLVLVRGWTTPGHVRSGHVHHMPLWSPSKPGYGADPCPEPNGSGNTEALTPQRTCSTARHSSCFCITPPTPPGDRPRPRVQAWVEAQTALEEQGPGEKYGG